MRGLFFTMLDLLLRWHLPHLRPSLQPGLSVPRSLMLLLLRPSLLQLQHHSERHLQFMRIWLPTVLWGMLLDLWKRMLWLHQRFCLHILPEYVLPIQ